MTTLEPWTLNHAAFQKSKVSTVIFAWESRIWFSKRIGECIDDRLYAILDVDDRKERETFSKIVWVRFRYTG